MSTPTFFEKFARSSACFLVTCVRNPAETLQKKKTCSGEFLKNHPNFEKKKTLSELSGTGDSQRDSRESIRANHSQLKPLFYSASGRFARIPRISDSRESADSRESCESIRANHATKSRSGKAILGATLGIPGYSRSNSRNGSHDLIYVKTLFLGATLGATLGLGWTPKFQAKFSERFFQNWGGPRAPDEMIMLFWVIFWGGFFLLLNKKTPKQKYSRDCPDTAPAISWEFCLHISFFPKRTATYKKKQV